MSFRRRRLNQWYPKEWTVYWQHGGAQSTGIQPANTFLQSVECVSHCETCLNDKSQFTVLFVFSFQILLSTANLVHVPTGRRHWTVESVLPEFLKPRITLASLEIGFQVEIAFVKRVDFGWMNSDWYSTVSFCFITLNHIESIGPSITK